ncbi:type 1 glutamine amidotransferase [Phytoactinopolyspora halotolerans]|uniref:Type 1 glutamine amidotransferase n=1 Tax=Phytoactinopolyspora halotolerans TaxID=1981512 RepID=A0A6L9S5J5_9ACTN|nr:type 1 glutamine amidotransferase [Phytoactinopolyspora halotolerans]NED99767.1 type 1 glutamine amidotransferase [Phytoactinopolyspora halotolerans]
MTSPRVLVVQNTPKGSPRRLGDWLAADGLDLDVVRAFDGATLPDRLEHDALIVLGGGYMPDDDTRATWLPKTRALTTQALERHRPMFGICLGGQLLAHVAGGKVLADAGAPEQGSIPLTLRAEARDDALFRDLPSVVNAVEHHVDAVTALPVGATWLASTERCPYQAFRVGELAWGVQFHPEASADRILEWDEDELRNQGFDRQHLYRQALADEPDSTRHWRVVARRFADTVKRQHG